MLVYQRVTQIHPNVACSFAVKISTDSGASVQTWYVFYFEGASSAEPTGTPNINRSLFGVSLVKKLVGKPPWPQHISGDLGLQDTNFKPLESMLVGTQTS